MTERATSTLSAILIDDEQLAREELSYLLKEFPDVEVLATGRNGLEAVKLIENLEPDVVFLDVQMPGLDGFGVIQNLREKNIPLPHFILATAYDQYAIEAFKWKALDYLLKPIEKDRLEMAVERAREAVTEKAKAAPQLEIAPLKASPQRGAAFPPLSPRRLVLHPHFLSPFRALRQESSRRRSPAQSAKPDPQPTQLRTHCATAKADRSSYRDRP